MQSTMSRTSIGSSIGNRAWRRWGGVFLRETQSKDWAWMVGKLAVEPEGKLRAMFFCISGKRSGMSVTVYWRQSGENRRLRTPVPALRQRQDVSDKPSEQQTNPNSKICWFLSFSKSNIDNGDLIYACWRTKRAKSTLRFHGSRLARVPVGIKQPFTYLACHKTLPVSPFRLRRAVVSWIRSTSMILSSMRRPRLLALFFARFLPALVSVSELSLGTSPPLSSMVTVKTFCRESTCPRPRGFSQLSETRFCSSEYRIKT